MKVMLCWSGSRGKAVATALHEWLPSVIQAIEPWMSDEDIEMGSRWEPELDKQLHEANFGIICLTPESLTALYIHFEAGALSKIINESHVCPYLLGLEPTDVIGPLTRFQSARANREGTSKLIKSINSAMGTSALPEERLDRVFDKWWPELEARLSMILQSSQIIESKRSDEDMVKEVLEIARDQKKILSKMLETHINYAGFIVESTSYKIDRIRISPSVAFNNEFLKKYTSYESWFEAVSDIKKNLGEDIDPLNFVLSDWPESLSSNMGFADWNGLRRAAIIEWALKNATISAKMW